MGKQKDLAGIFGDLGKGFKKVFRAKEKEKAATTDDGHGIFTYGFAYANDLAKSGLDKENPSFPTGSILVREKRSWKNASIPDRIIAMAKREKGFSKETGDWEFFAFDGKDMKREKRETKGDCAKCHIQAEKSDWVFKYDFK